MDVMRVDSEYCEDVAEELVNIFLIYSDENREISLKGLKMMGDVFDDVPMDLRETTFGYLLDELDNRNIEYNIEEFKGEIPVGETA